MEPIAIIGLAFRLPQGVEDEYSFWDMLKKGENAMTPWPESRTNFEAFFQPEASTNNTMQSKGAHFLGQDPAIFDAPFFSISSKEAASMDPQQRLLLETTYHAMESAGIPVEHVRNTQTGVFAGSMESDYHRLISKDPDEAPASTATGASVSILANRLSWYFDLKGPSMQINTACSSSMIAVDLACQSLRLGQSSMALVTGSNLILTPELSLYLSNLGMLSPDGVCYSFDHRANGYGRGEGIIVLVLKTLSGAVRSRDNIRAIIRGAGSNQDGRTPGITQPNFVSQEKLIRQLYRECNLGFESTRYVEAHGTGTQLGDSTEIKAIGAVFRKSRSGTAPLYVGSVKSNVGHLEGASGLAGILKCIMILEKGVIPPNALFQKLNAKINARRDNIEVPASCVSWPASGLRRVSVNSFGFGGSNAHVIIDDTYHALEAICLETGLNGNYLLAITRPEGENMMLVRGADKDGQEGDAVDGSSGCEDQSASHSTSSTEKRLNMSDTFSTNSSSATSSISLSLTAERAVIPEESPAGFTRQLLIFSAGDEAALKRLLQQHSHYYDNSVLGSTSNLKRLAHTLAARRSIMAMRSFAVGSPKSPSDAIGLPNSDCVRSSLEPQLCFVFTGQGAQYAKMGLDLIQYPVFKSALIEANTVFQGLGANWSLFDKLETGKDIDLPQFSQPACTALQIALIELLGSFKVAPAAVVGHSSGEIAAAYAVGALSLESACKIAYHRGRLSGQLAASTKPGAMMSVNMQEGQFPAYMEKRLPGADVHIACVNSPLNITLAGLEKDIDTLKGHLDNDAIFAKKLKTSLAYHTPIMRDIASDYLSSLNDLKLPTANCKATLMVSSVTGQRVAPSELSGAQYWVDNLTSPVRFVDALQYLSHAAPKLDGIKAISDYIEIGPHGALRRPILESLSQNAGGNGYKYTSVLSKLTPPVHSVMEFAGRIFTRGYPVSVTAVNQHMVGIDDSLVVTDAPQYPFNRSQRYWHETRLSRDWRLRAPAPRDVLGICSTDWNPLEPRWRKMISVDQEPWVADHVVDGNIIFPAAGLVVMALEAVRQGSQASQTISGYLVKEATFISPVSIQPEKKTELITQLRALRHSYEKTSLRFQVSIFALHNGNWNESFSAVVHAKVKEVAREVDGGLEARVAEQALSSSYKDAKALCTNSVSKQTFYEGLSKQSLSYGDAFALAEDIFWDGDELCTASINIRNLVEPYQGIVHPTVLDTCLQLCSTAPSAGMSKDMSTTIPHRMGETWISATGWQLPRAQTIQVKTQSRFNTASTGLQCSFTALAEDGTPLCHAKRVGMTTIANKASRSDEKRALLHGIDWKPQLSLLLPSQLSEVCGADRFSDDESPAVEYCIRLEAALRTHLQRNLTQLRATVGSDTPEHLKHFVSWIERQLEKSPGRSEEEWSNESLSRELDDLRETRPSWRIFIDVAMALNSVIRGHTNALELLFSTPLAQDLYDEFFRRTCNHKLHSYLELATHQNPDQKILEVGAGTGGMTNQVLSILRQMEDRTGGTAFGEYVYTDISTAYFDEARERFADYRHRMLFKTVDLEHDIGSQGIEAGTYDMVLAGSVLHATENLSDTLNNLRRALKPGGQLVLLETTAPDCFVTSFGFGILPGWWCGKEESRTWCPTVTEVEWDTLLRSSGFSGNDLVIRDYEDERAHYVSIIVSSAVVPSHAVLESSRMVVVVNDQDEQQASLAHTLVDGSFRPSGYRADVFALSRLADAQVHQTDIVVFLADMGTSLLNDGSDATFKLVQGWLQQSRQLLWVTASTVSQSSYPYSSLKDGLLRVMRSENISKRIVSLSMENDLSHTLGSMQAISQICDTAFESASTDSEYVFRDGKILTGRLVQAIDLDKSLTSCLQLQTRDEAWLPGPPLKFDGIRGSLDTLRFIEDHDHYAPLGPTDIEVEKKAWAIGFRDVFGALGRLDENEFGTDCAGVVNRVGSQCSRLRPGDRVCTSSFGCMRTYVRTEESDAIQIPDSLSFEEACGVINPGMTALYSLIHVARLQRGEKVLIHAASGATGQVAIQVAKMLGAEIFATVGYDDKKQLLIDDYGIPASHIFYSRDLSFVQGVMRVTNGNGVDVVLNSLVGEGLRGSWECIAPYGRFIEIGKADIQANAPLPMACFANNVSFSAVDLRHLSFHRIESARQLFRTTLDLVQDGTIHCPRPWRSYSVSAIEEAFRYLQSGKNTGRVIITITDSAKVEKHLLHRKTWTFDGHATYVVVGGLGGVGRSILKWMASKGAKHLIVPSRSGATSKAALQLVNELTKQGVEILTPKCDVSVKSSLQSVLADHEQKRLGPIRGCINAAMVLQDSVFDNMTHFQWESTIRSKVDSSWNLHTLLPKELDFFILLSSAAGIIGNAGQSNYAAGCTFQDSLSQYRLCHGHNAVSIDLGPMRSVGVVAENKELKTNFDKYPGLTPIEEREFLALLDICCDPQYPASRSSARSQITMGIVTPAELVLEGGDLPLEHMLRTLFAHFQETGARSSTSASASGINYAALFRKAETPEQMTAIVVQSLSQKLARALSIEAENIDVDKPLHLYGVDSLVAVELRNWITKEFATDVPVFELMSGKTVIAIGELVTKNSEVSGAS